VRKYFPGTGSPGTVVPFSCPSLCYMSGRDLAVLVGFHLHIPVLDHKHTDCDGITRLDISNAVSDTRAMLLTVGILGKSIRDDQTAGAAADDHVVI
jgi:hypothetical protein